jgi:hypothetical protein
MVSGGGLESAINVFSRDGMDGVIDNDLEDVGVNKRGKKRDEGEGEEQES